ncbi:hypothetical protein TRIUR3_19159 [Triticum urartu]|uniref:Pectinesterase inhibitor domain-containing protein n=2 Tax=Triticum TaxID=4564 RepID=A0A9R0QL69_TRITD|nr:hypothetical protein TRIUR3_19159 [Triticum urartu]VAH11213.1 unnamed protein product [Triticum turgidum subsp. durum]
MSSSKLIRSSLHGRSVVLPSVPWPYCDEVVNFYVSSTEEHDVGVSPAVNPRVLPAAASSNDTLQRGIVATNQTAQSVTSTLHIISDLVRDLNTCTGYYTTMASTVAAALDDLHAGRVVNATDKLNDALGAPSDCDILLSGVGVIGKVDRNPIRKENGENEKLVQLAINILNPPRS